MVITWRDTQNTLVLDCSGRELREHVLRASALLRGLATATCCRYAGGRFQIESLCSLGIDESQVDAILAKHEVDTVYPETLSFTQQIQQIAGAELIVAPHGPGASNLEFASPVAEWQTTDMTIDVGALDEVLGLA